MSGFLSAFAIYFVIWWLTLFIVLPHGNRSQAEVGEVIQGTDPGAPAKSNLPQKLIWNSLLAGVVYGIYWIVTSIFGWDFNDIPKFFPKN